MAAALAGLTANATAATTVVETSDIDGSSFNTSTVCRVEGGISLSDSEDVFSFTGLTPGATVNLSGMVLITSDPAVELRFLLRDSSNASLASSITLSNGSLPFDPVTVPGDGIVNVSIRDANGQIQELGESGSYAVTVPETGSTALAALAGLVSLTRRIRKK